MSLGHLIGSNRQYIEEVIPHIGSLLAASVAEVLKDAEVVVIATRGLDANELRAALRPDHIVIDLVNLERGSRPATSGRYEGICW